MGVHVDASEMQGDQMLHYAAESGRADLIKGLVTRGGMDVNQKNAVEETALHIAARHGSNEAAQELLRLGADKDARSVDGETPLHIAARNNHVEIVRMLLGKNAGVDLKNREGQTALHLAAERGNKDILEMLLQSGADKDARSVDGETPLHAAAGHRHREGCGDPYSLGGGHEAAVERQDGASAGGGEGGTAKLLQRFHILSILRPRSGMRSGCKCQGTTIFSITSL